MRKRADEEVNAENLDAELQKLESELTSDDECGPFATTCAVMLGRKLSRWGVRFPRAISSS